MQLCLLNCSCVFQVGFDGGHDDARFHGKKIKASEGKTDPCIHNNSFVEDPIQNVKQPRRLDLRHHDGTAPFADDEVAESRNDVLKKNNNSVGIIFRTMVSEVNALPEFFFIRADATLLMRKRILDANRPRGDRSNTNVNKDWNICCHLFPVTYFPCLLNADRPPRRADRWVLS